MGSHERRQISLGAQTRIANLFVAEGQGQQLDNLFFGSLTQVRQYEREVSFRVAEIAAARD
jgi:hypothetical protein